MGFFGVFWKNAAAPAERSPLRMEIQTALKIMVFVESIHADVSRDSTDQSAYKVKQVYLGQQLLSTLMFYANQGG